MHVYVCVCVALRIPGRARVSARQGVGAYGDPAALDEWVESQGRSEDRRGSACPRETATRVSPLPSDISPCIGVRRYVAFVFFSVSARYLARRGVFATPRERDIVAPSASLAKSFASALSSRTSLFSFLRTRAHTSISLEKKWDARTARSNNRRVFGKVRRFPSFAEIISIILLFVSYAFLDV